MDKGVGVERPFTLRQRVCVPSLGDLRGAEKRPGSPEVSERGQKRQRGARSHRGLEALI